MGALSLSSPLLSPSLRPSLFLFLSFPSLSIFLFLSLARLQDTLFVQFSRLLPSSSLSLTLSSLLLTHVRVCGLSRYTAIVFIDACAARLYARANLPCADRRLSINGLVVQRNISPYPERACWKNDNSLFDGIRPAFLSLSLYRRRIVFSIFSFPLSFLSFFFSFFPHFTDLTPHSCFFFLFPSGSFSRVWFFRATPDSQFLPLASGYR